MDALKLFQEYMGTGLIVLWFLVSLLYLWLTEKRKYIRVMFLYVPLVLLLVFFNPLVAKIVSQMADGEIYYRILWLLPVTPVIAFGTVQLCGKLAGRKRYGGITLAIVLFTISGSLMRIMYPRALWISVIPLRFRAEKSWRHSRENCCSM